ncbi:hypothetical protein ACEWY4_015028 [Coilia grayii]|uniref:Bcl-2 Bcl-2 homology region 1-3 domain-containing protein n=1 Tax=Coilia grayii TaxID=363190 RepID=A0ABD1JTW3_9TELE
MFVNVMSLLPKPKPSNVTEDKLIGQIAQIIRVSGDEIRDKYDKKMTDTIDGLKNHIVQNPEKRDIYQKVVEQVFDDGEINWGRIVMLFYTVAKIAKELVTCLPGGVSDMISWTVGYLKKNVVGWILKMGGWMCSIAAIARFRITTVQLRCPPKPSSERAIAFTYLTTGMLLGGIVVFWLTGNARH